MIILGAQGGAQAPQAPPLDPPLIIYSQAPNDNQEDLELQENAAYKATTFKFQENTAYAATTQELQDQTTTDIIINLKDLELHENAAYVSTTYEDFELQENTAYFITNAVL